MRRPAAGPAVAAVAVAVLLLAAVSASAQEPRASLPDIEDEVMCPICGTLLELSEAPQAERQRALIRDLIAEGRSKEEIKDRLVAEYGPEVLATPEDEGFDLAAWLVPGVLLAALAAAGIVVLRRSRRDGGGGEAAALDAADEARLREDIARYDG